MTKSVEYMLKEKGLELHDCIQNEEVLVHPSTLRGNKIEIRIIIVVEIDGQEYEFNDVRKIALKKTKSAIALPAFGGN